MSIYGRGYYSNGRPHWDDQFRETEWEKRERQRKRRETEAAKVVAPDPPASTVMAMTLRAIKARVDGEFDQPDLMAKGPLGDMYKDISTWCNAALEVAETATIATIEVDQQRHFERFQAKLRERIEVK